MRTLHLQWILPLLIGFSPAAAATVLGPYNGSFIAGGTGLEKRVTGSDGYAAGAPFSIYCWFRTDGVPNGPTLIAGVGDPSSPSARYLGIDTSLGFWNGAWIKGSGAALAPNEWHFAAATFDGKVVRLYSDGVSVAEQPATLAASTPTMVMAPDKLPWAGGHFAGRIVGFTVTTEVLDTSTLATLGEKRPQFDLIAYEAGSKCWPFQTRGQAGYRAPQDPSTLPHSDSPFQTPHAKPVREGPVLQQRSPHDWTLANGWQLIEAPKMPAGGADLSRAGYKTQGWYAATVPGTVLTTLIDRGVYPDPDYGLNNLAIPESLSRQNYWYRVEFDTPQGANKRWNLTFEGINYAAEVWLNGKRAGNIVGAFVRGDFDVTGLLSPHGKNALAVLISPPPHPGIGHEQSIKAGAGENGGTMCLDGPTFVCSEGWDWIPAVRDRNTGIWQDVRLTSTGTVRLGDPKVVTKLPLPATNAADVTIAVPLRNSSAASVRGVLHASFEGVDVSEPVTVAPGETLVSLAPGEYPALHVNQPRLWWPNGYGKPELYHLGLSFTVNGSESDRNALRFGMREITYEMSLLDPGGAVRRVEYFPEMAAGRDEHVIDTRHEGIIRAAQGWMYSIVPGAEHSPSMAPVQDQRTAPYLVVRVNGVRIACKGGSWGIDDSRKRSSREHLEPFFRLHRDANITMIRNWVGQSTEEVFFDLADEYGLMVWSDFWESTQDYNVEPSDSALFLANARETLLRYRNHPSIVVWCGRNEGVPPPAINTGLDSLNRELDGTRLYVPDSNQIELANSGPYLHHDAEDYFTKLSVGFAVEVGIPSFPTIEAFQAAVPAVDQWPPSDTWAYHDWHWSGNGNTHPFMTAVEKQFGAATGLADFERKAQMINYVNHRAIFEGMNAHLWDPNSGRMLWMTQPAWPSTNWQILSADYDTQASFYGTKKGCEPVHVQMNLPGMEAAVVNNTAGAMNGLTLRARTFSLDGKEVFTREQTVDAAPVNATSVFTVGMAVDGVSLVKLELLDAQHHVLSDNFYWHAPDAGGYLQLNDLPEVELKSTVTQTRTGDQVHVTLRLENASASPALMAKATVVDPGTGKRILPAYFSDNYVSLLPGETKTLEIETPVSAVRERVAVTLRGWNVKAAVLVEK